MTVALSLIITAVARARAAVRAMASTRQEPPPASTRTSAGCRIPMDAYAAKKTWGLGDSDSGKPRTLIDFFAMYLDELPSIRIRDMRRSGIVGPEMRYVAVTLQARDALVSTEVRVVRFRMRSGGVFLQFVCGRRARVLRLHEAHIVCGRCTGLRYWCEGKPAVRRAQHRITRLKATRFHGGPVSRRPGRTMERRAQLTASLRRSAAIVRRHVSGRILVALKARPVDSDERSSE
jgi:hypothetical protein